VKGNNPAHHAQIISIGHELLRGEITDTNAAYLARELRSRGVIVSSIHTLPDDRDSAARLIGSVLIRRGIIILTGGLGGTRDDVTRTILSRVLDRDLVVDGEGEEKLREWYRSRGRSFEEPDRMQAAAPSGGRLLRNEVGLAFGFYIHDGQRHIFSLPGVPEEMKSMFQNSVSPILDSADLTYPMYHYEYLNFMDISEYTLDRGIEKIVAGYGGVTYGTRSNSGMIRVRLETNGGLRELQKCLDAIERRFTESFIYRGEPRFEEVVGDLLRDKKRTLAAAESCTGGLLSGLLTDVPGSSDYFLGGVVSYSNDAKTALLGVSNETLTRFGAVSRETALEMAEGVLQRFSSDTALSVTGIAGPGGGSPEKPVGTVFMCLAARDGTRVNRRNEFLGDRATVRLRSANKAMGMLFNYLREC
jgi:nicotinamide-nucleotide amidase